MLRIEEVDDKNYLLKLTRFIDREDFIEINSQLKSLYVFYNAKEKGWVVTKNKISDLYDYLTMKLKMEVDISNIELPEKNNTEVKVLKTTFTRSSKFDDNVLQVKLYDYQREDVLWLLKRSRAMIASDPGTGKTIESIAVFSQLKKEGKIDSVFMLVKNNLTYHWYREILEYSSLYTEKDILIITNKNKKNFFNSDVPEIVICPNHIFKDVVQSIPSNISFKDLWFKKSICLIIDECHEFKNMKAKKTESLFSILDNFNYRYLLSATPAINGFEDWYSQMNILDNSIIPLSENKFKMDIARTIGTDYDPYKITSYKPERLKEYVNSFKVWVTKRIKSELPEMKTKQFIKPIYFEMSDTHIKLYNIIREVYIKKAKEEGGTIQYKDIENKYPYLMMVIDNPSLLVSRIKEESDTAFKILDNLLNKWKLEDYNKLDYLDDFLKDKIENQNEKVIIFDTHPLTLDQLYDRYKSYNPLIIHGRLKQSNEERQNIVDLFNDKDSKNKLILLNVQTGGTGLNLQKSCNTIIYYNLPYDTTLTRQSLDRTYRITSTRDSFVEILCYGKSFDEIRMKKNLKRIDDNDYIFKNDNEEILI